MQKLFSITIKDFDIQTFSVGGHGGGGKDTSNSGVRLIHRDSGAVGVGTENRSNTLNRQSAFKKLVATTRFQGWFKKECAKRLGQKTLETLEELKTRVDQQLDQDIQNGLVKIEVF